MEEWNDGILEEWRNIGLEQWNDGGMEEDGRWGREHSEGSMKERNRVYGEIRDGKTGEQEGGAIVQLVEKKT